MDLAKIILVAACVLLPYCAFMVILAVISTRAKWRPAQRILQNIRTGKSQNDRQLNNQLKVYIIVSIVLIMIFALGFVFAAVTSFAYYLGYPNFIPKFDLEVSRIAFISLLLFGIIATGILLFLWRKIDKRIDR